MYKLPLSLNQKDVLLISHGLLGKETTPTSSEVTQRPPGRVVQEELYVLAQV